MGIRYGIAHLTQRTETFLDTCDAILSWTKIAWSEDAMKRFTDDPERDLLDIDWATFRYDDTREVPVVPAGVLFLNASTGNIAVEYAGRWVTT